MRSRLVRIALLALGCGIAAGSVFAQRERTRPRPRGSTAVSESQAGELTLTVTDVAVRPIQVWVRTAGVIQQDRRTLLVSLPSDARVESGQRVRAFSPRSRSRMNQGTVTRVAREGGGLVATVALAGEPADPSRHYVLEIVTEEGEFLSVPNEAILESEDRQVVYVREATGSYAPRDVTIGVRGELFTQVLGGVKPGEQVVTIGSFFIDAEHRLKGS